MLTLAEAVAVKFPHVKAMEFPVHTAPWLPALVQNPAFLAGSPEFEGVTVNLPLSTADSELLSTAYSERYGWAYDNLMASAKRHEILPDLPAVHPMVPDTPPRTPTAHLDRQPLVDAISAYILTAAPNEAVVLRLLLNALSSGQGLSVRGLALALLAAEL